VEASTEIVSVDEPDPGAAIDDGLKAAVVPAGRPEADSAIEELKLPESVEVIVEEPVPPWPTVIDEADDESEK
jgi:hypothetical protein